MFLKLSQNLSSLNSSIFNIHSKVFKSLRECLLQAVTLLKEASHVWMLLEPKIYGEYKFPLCSHFWDAEGDLEEQDNSEGPLEAHKRPEKVEKKISETFFYNYEDIYSCPFVTEDSGIPINLLSLKYPFCWSCANLKLRIFNICS